MLGKEIEFGRPSLYLETASPTLIIALCCEHMACVTVRRDPDGDSESQDSHMDGDDHEERSNKESPESPINEHRKHLAAHTSRALRPRSSDSALNYLYAHSPEDSGSPAHSTGWSSVRNAIDFRMRGKIFQQRELEDEGQYSSFRLFRSGGEPSGDMATFASEKVSLNVLRVRKYSGAGSRMKQLARDNMPFMGLEVHGVEEVALPKDLPHTTAMKQRGIKINNLDDLLGTKFAAPLAVATSHVHTEGADTLSVPPSGQTSRRSSLGKGSRKDVNLPSRKHSQADPGLPCITERSDTQSVSTDV